MKNISLYGLSPKELQERLNLEKNYQGKQVFEWLIKGEDDFDNMTTLSVKERERLKSIMPSALSSKVIESQTDESGATKIAIQLHDKALIEAVLLTDKEGRKTACLSSQVGCAMGCEFCRTATMGFIRNLEAFEIIEQFVHLMKINSPITHIVFMGMGEPLHNLDNVVRAIQFLNDPKAFNIGMRRITISTSGLVPGLIKLIEKDLAVKLAVSLVTADNDKRNIVMPINNAYPLEQLKEALVRYQKRVNKRFTLEYVMLKDFNLEKEDAIKLAKFSENLDVVVNLIPYNPAAELDWQTPSTKEIDSFTDELTRLRVNFTRRYSRGRSINGACGQLATKQRGSF